MNHLLKISRVVCFLVFFFSSLLFQFETRTKSVNKKISQNEWKARESSKYVSVSRRGAHVCVRDFLIKSNFEKWDQVSAHLWCCSSFKKNYENRGREMALQRVLEARSQPVIANLNFLNELSIILPTSARKLCPSYWETWCSFSSHTLSSFLCQISAAQTCQRCDKWLKYYTILIKSYI